MFSVRSNCSGSQSSLAELGIAPLDLSGIGDVSAPSPSKPDAALSAKPSGMSTAHLGDYDLRRSNCPSAVHAGCSLCLCCAEHSGGHPDMHGNACFVG
jgi:hypothetical protein